jgi:hydrogenase expression/formation protein HypD
MKYITEFRSPEYVNNIIGKIRSITKHPWNIMEVCGGQTHTIVRYQLQKLLPVEINLIHGPGCPVCVTPEIIIDQAIEISKKPNVILTSFGDMLRVPSNHGSLLEAKASGAKIQIVYSPLDAIQIALQNPDSEVVFLAIGFETTTAPNALAVLQAEALNINNFSVLVSQVRVPPAIESLINSKDSQIHGFLAAGNVCTVMGLKEYQPLVDKYKVPIVATGFEPTDILFGILQVVTQLESGIARLEVAYSRSVTWEGNTKAQNAISKVFKHIDQNWRGLGTIPQSGWGLSDAYKKYDAHHKFQFKQNLNKYQGHQICESGAILSGIKRPPECAQFGKSCRPDNPLGAPMVSSEGACAAYYNYQVRG